jgi:Ca-activated chloride channel family protein
MVNIYIALAVFAFCVLAEVLHLSRTRRLASLAFGPDESPSFWTILVPVIKPFAAAALCWGLLTLMNYKDNSGKNMAEIEEVDPDEIEHVMVIMDVSPSMYLEDSGEDGVTTRKNRAKVLLESMMERITADNVRYSMVAVFTDSLPVVIDSSDRDVILNILELPMDQAFTPGKTNLIKGVERAFEIAKDWKPESCTCVMISDGDATADTGMPTAPKSVKNFLVAGVGSSRGMFIDGHQSRQDSISLKRIATRLRGNYEDANIKHISTKILGDLAGAQAEEEEKSGLKEIALLSCGIGAFLLAALPVLLNLFGFNHTGSREFKRELTTIRGG